MRPDPLELARACIPLARAWVSAARRALGCESTELLRSALETSFAWRAVRDEREHLRHIDRTLASIEEVLGDETRFAKVSFSKARKVFRSEHVPPAYAIFGDHVYVTPVFAEFGPLCRTAMVVHESVHVFDARSGEPEIHVSEWDERFASRTPEQQLHNPSAYASFTAQIHEGRLEWPREARYGAGNPRL